MVNRMEKDFDEFVAKRCEKALMENKEYIALERSGAATQEELQALAEVICYKQCFEDFVSKKKM